MLHQEQDLTDECAEGETHQYIEEFMHMDKFMTKLEEEEDYID
jgi:hypothetical protein